MASSGDRTEVYTIYSFASIALIIIITLYSGYRKQNRLRKLGHKWSKWMPAMLQRDLDKFANQSAFNAQIIAGVKESTVITTRMQKLHEAYYHQLRQRRSSQGGPPSPAHGGRARSSPPEKPMFRFASEDADDVFDLDRSAASPSPPPGPARDRRVPMGARPGDAVDPVRSESPSVDSADWHDDRSHAAQVVRISGLDLDRPRAVAPHTTETAV
mmetsp:Transcript_31274/g.81992  ORF Transcript_31274/g.81992 Transcript_31274/m.81992 type:complete len:214 (+) Transcript_31274:93-734(+)